MMIQYIIRELKDLRGALHHPRPGSTLQPHLMDLHISMPGNIIDIH